MRSLNVRLLAIIVGLGVFIAIATYGLNRFQIYRHADFYYKTAQRTKNSDQIEQRRDALKNLQRYVSLCPKDNDVRAEMGSLMVDIAKTGGPKYRQYYGDAFHAFEFILRDDYTRSDVRRDLVEVAIINRRYKDAEEHLEFLFEESPDDAELLTWLGQCQADKEEDADAKESFKKAIENNPKLIEPYIQLASLLRKDVVLRGDRDLNPMVEVPAGSAANDAKPDDAKSGDTQPGDAKPAEEKTDDVKVDAEKPAADAKSDDAKKDAAKPDASKADDKKADTKNREDAKETIIKKEDENHPDTWMNRMVKANPDSPRVYLVRGQYLLTTQKPDEAGKDAAQALQHMPLAMHTVGAALSQTGKELGELAEALPSKPDSTVAAIEKLNTAAKEMEKAANSASKLSDMEETSDEDKVISLALKDAPKAIRAAGETVVEIAVEHDDDDDVAEAIKVVNTANSKTIDEFEGLNNSLEGALLLLARCQAKKSQIGTARLLANRAQVYYMDSAAVYLLLSQLARHDKDPAKAREWVEMGLDIINDSPVLLWEKANFLIDDLAEATKTGQGDRGKILQEIADVSESLRTSPSIYQEPVFRGYLSARAAFVQGKWTQARKELDAIHAELAIRAPGLALQCDQMSVICNNRLGRPDLAKAAQKRTLLKSSPASSLLIEVGQLISQDKFDEAATKLDKYIEDGDIPDDAWVVLAQYYLNVNRSPNNKKQDWPLFEKILDMALKSKPDDERLPLITAESLIAQEKMDEAFDILAKACKKNPKDVRIWQSLIRINQKKEDWKTADKLLLDARKELGDPLELRLAEALLSTERDGTKSSPTLKRLAENLDQYSDADKIQLYGYLTVCARQIDDLELAHQLCRKAADADPTNMKLRISLFEIAGQKKDAAAMAAALEEIREIEQEGPNWHFYAAMRLATKAEQDGTPALYDDALKHLAQAKELRQNWERIPMLAGTIELRKGNKKEAIEHFREAVEKGSRDKRGIGALVSLLYERGLNDEAQRMSALLKEQGGQISDYGKWQEAIDELLHGDQDKGLKDLHQIAENSEDFNLHLRLGVILGGLARQAKLSKNDKRSQELFADAEKSLRKAAEMAPNETIVWISLVQSLSDSGKESEALKVISDVRKTVEKKRLPLVLARCFQSLGRDSEAEQHYKAALANSDGKDSAARMFASFYLQDKKSKKAEAILKQMTEGKQASSEADISWARRRMALILYSQGGMANRRDAIEMLNKNLKSNPNSMNDIREKAKLLAMFGSLEELREAAKLTEKLLSLPNPNPSDRFLMSGIMLSLDNWPGVTRHMQQLLAEENIQPAWLGFYIDALLDRNEIASAESYLRRLQRIDPNDDSVVIFTSQILAARDQYDKVLEILDKYINSTNPADVGRSIKDSENKKTIRLFNATKTLEALMKRLPKTEKGNDPKKYASAKKLMAKAEEYWRQIAKRHPDGNLRLVRFLSRHGKCDEALDIVETAWSKGDPESIATTAVSLVANGNATPEQIKRVERIINDASITFGESNPFMLAMAELRSTQKRYEEAEALYRKVLAKNPRDFVALNNLSVFLALRNIKADESLKLINQAIDIVGAKPVLRDTRASAYIAGGDWNRAIAELEAAIGGKPTPLRLFHQAQAYYGAKQKDKAIASLKKAHDMGLSAEDLQPLERPAYRKLLEDLK